MCKKSCRFNLDYCLCIEDDFKLSPSFVKIISKCEKIIKQHDNIDIIYFHNNGIMYLDKKINDDFYRGKSLGACCILITKKFINKINTLYKKYLYDGFHYDYFLSSIALKSYIHIPYAGEVYSFQTDNDNWSKNNILINFAQKLNTYTTLHMVIHHKFIINLCIFLIETKQYKILNYIILLTNKFYSNNLK